MKPIVSRTAIFIASERLGLSPAPAPIAMAPGGATGFCDVISRRTGRRAWRYHDIINEHRPGATDPSRHIGFRSLGTTSGGSWRAWKKQESPLPVSRALRYNSAAAPSGLAASDECANLAARCNQIQQLQSIQQMKATEEEVS